MSRRSSTTTKVFVGNLPANATVKDLRELFAPYGAIAECDIAIRCGFLHLEDGELAMKAIEELNNTTFMGVRISVEKGRVKSTSRRGRGDSVAGPVRSVEKERGGPYSRDNLGRPPRNENFGAGRDYVVYGDHYGYDRAGRFDEYVDRRPMYDERRATDPYGRSYPNGYTYDERSYVASSGYDDRRMAPPTSTGYDDRYSGMGTERRSVVDQSVSQSVSQSKPLQTSYDRSQADMYSRRDTISKPLERPATNYSTTSTNYGVSSTPTYGQTTGGWTSGGYGDSRTTSTIGYDSRTNIQPGAYGDSRATMPQGFDNRSASSQMSSSMYSDSRSAPIASMSSYSSTATNLATPTNYTTIQSTGYDTYGTTRTASYDASYPPLPQQRTYASGGGPAPRRDMPPGPGRRY